MKSKRLAAIVLAVLMALTVIPAAVFAETEPARKAEELPKKESITALETGDYAFMWSYEKDGTVNGGDDRVFIDDFEILRALLLDLDVALNPDGADPSSPDYLSFTNDGDYPFEVVDHEYEYGDDRVEAWTTNQGIANSCCSTTTRIMVGASGATISFDYAVSCEYYHDRLAFYIDGTIYGVFSGDDNWAWQTFSRSVGAGMHEFTWAYEKDSCVNSGHDTAVLDNVRITGDFIGLPGGLPGDVNGDGSVTAVDAMLALRYSMHLITLTSEQIARGDVNGDGSVTTTDAITILRMSMGLI
ncbi:MAG: dockerin type I repeat-containing protein [Clostridia bacterium]|nr:dockerin type I repeat-containing protein [Clostridia bacterium]